jgi:hypothetical protein
MRAGPVTSRNNRRRDDRGGDDQGDLGAWFPAIAVVPLVLLGFLGAAQMLRRESARPVVGDMVVFMAGSHDREMFRIAVPAQRVEPGIENGRVCVLNSNVMAAGGGSLIVERRLATDPPLFHLHWAGGRTDDGPLDCGSAATVAVARIDLRKLATAAGGFGVGRRSGLR